MKLNLLPTTVSRGKQAQSAIFLSALIAIIGILAGGFLNITSSHARDEAYQAQQQSVGPANDAYTESNKADAIMADENSVDLIKDANLAQTMIAHNDVYPDLYNSVLPYIPSFYRINSINASSQGEGATITLVGTLDTYQQYADLMLALSRYQYVDPKTKTVIKPTSISRSGFIDRSEVVPNINEVDEVGKPRRLDAAPIPDDKLDRLAYFSANVQQEGYSGEGNFGTGTDNTRGAMPTASLVTVTMSIPWNLQVPDPRTTLMAAPAAAAPSANVGGPPGMPPGAMGGPGGGPPMGAGGPPMGAGGTGGMRGGRGAGGDAGAD